METEKMDQEVSDNSEVTSTVVETEEAKDEMPKQKDHEKDADQSSSRHCGEGNSKITWTYESLSQLILPSVPETQCEKRKIKLVNVECSHCGNRFRKNFWKPSALRSERKAKKEKNHFRKKMHRLTKLLKKL